MTSIITVTSAAESHNLTTLATVKEELSITGSDKDDLLNRWIREASAAIAGYCNRVFGAETVLEAFRSGYNGSLVLDRYPVISMTSIAVDDTALVAADYELDAQTGVLYRLTSDARSTWSGAVEIAYRGGYELLDALPSEIEQACILLVKGRHFSRLRDPLVKSEEIPNVMSTSYWVGTVGGSSSLPPEIVALLSPHRRISI